MKLETASRGGGNATLEPQRKHSQARHTSARPPSSTKRRYSKTKFGCKTCRVRKIRCDETSPVCNNCTKSNRRCDGVAEPANKVGELTFTAPLTLTHFRPTQTGWLSQQELAYLDLFRHELVYSIVGPTGTSAWKRLILQAVHEEVALCHAVVAFSAVGNCGIPLSYAESPESSERSMSPPPKNNASRENEFALRHYGKALEAMRHVYHYNDGRSICTALLCTLLCVCFELRIREPTIALTHLEHGLQVIEANLQSIDPAITAAFARLDRQAAIFLGMRPPALNSERIRSNIFVFDSVFQEAEHVFACLANRSWVFIRSTADDYRYRDSGTPGDEVLAEALEIEVALHDFNQQYLLPSSRAERMSADQYSTLRIEYLTTLIMTSCCLCLNETVYDQYAASFVEIVNLASGMIERQPQALKQRSKSGKSQFQLDMVVIHPLYTTAIKCRCPVTRRRAIEALYDGPELEGAFEGIVNAKIAERVVAFEEQSLDVDVGKMRDGQLLQIPADNLVHSVDIYIEPPQRRASVYFSRRLATLDGSCGEWDNVHEDISW